MGFESHIHSTTPESEARANFKEERKPERMVRGGRELKRLFGLGRRHRKPKGARTLIEVHPEGDWLLTICRVVSVKDEGINLDIIPNTEGKTHKARAKLLVEWKHLAGVVQDGKLDPLILLVDWRANLSSKANFSRKCPGYVQFSDRQQWQSKDLLGDGHERQSKDLLLNVEVLNKVIEWIERDPGREELWSKWLSPDLEILKSAWFINTPGDLAGALNKDFPNPIALQVVRIARPEAMAELDTSLKVSEAAAEILGLSHDGYDSEACRLFYGGPSMEWAYASGCISSALGIDQWHSQIKTQPTNEQMAKAKDAATKAGYEVIKRIRRFIETRE